MNGYPWPDWTAAEWAATLAPPRALAYVEAQHPRDDQGQWATAVTTGGLTRADLQTGKPLTATWYQGGASGSSASPYQWLTTDPREAARYARAAADRSASPALVTPTTRTFRNPLVTTSGVEILNAGTGTLARLAAGGHDALVYWHGGGVQFRGAPPVTPRVWAFVPTPPRTLAFNPQQPRDDQGQWTVTPGLLATILQPDGGFTYSPATAQSPTSGFVVALPQHERVIEARDANTVALEIAQYAAAHWAELTQPGNYLGGWHDPVSDKLFFDISRVFPPDQEAAARAFAEASHQLAYFNLDAGTSVPLPAGTHAPLHTHARADGPARRAADGRGPRGPGQEVDGRGAEYDDDPQDAADPRTRGLARRSSSDTPPPALYTLADRQRGDLRAAVLFALARARQAVDRPALRAATTVAQAHRAVSAVVPTLRAALRDLLPGALTRLHRAAMLHTDPEVETAVSATWAAQATQRLTEQLVDTTARRLDAGIADVFAEPRTAARAPSVHTLVERLQDVLDDAIGSTARADLVATHEGVVTAAAGQRAAWTHGGPPSGAQRMWVTQPNCCPLCDAMDGETTGINAPYASGDEIPMHLHCRCYEVLV